MMEQVHQCQMCPKPDSFVQSDFEYFLPYIANIEVSERGKISIFRGAAAEVPKPPAVHPSMMKVAQVFVPAFTFAPPRGSNKKRTSSKIYDEGYWRD